LRYTIHALETMTWWKYDGTLIYIILSANRTKRSSFLIHLANFRVGRAQNILLWVESACELYICNRLTISLMTYCIILFRTCQSLAGSFYYLRYVLGNLKCIIYDTLWEKGLNVQSAQKVTELAVKVFFPNIWTLLFLTIVQTALLK
jgi:hypothetical protein